MSDVQEAGWGWFTTDYSEIPEIQRDDQEKPHWSDNQAAAFVLRELAIKDPKAFAEALVVHVSALMAHYMAYAMNSEDAALQFTSNLEAMVIGEGTMIAVTERDFGIKLPDEVPDWLKGVE